MMKFYQVFISIVCICCVSLSVKAQIQFSNYQGGQALFNTYNDLKYGLSESKQITVQLRRDYNYPSPERWKLTVRLQDDFIYGSYRVPAEMATLRPNVQSGSFRELSTSVLAADLPLNRYSESVILESTTPLSYGDPFTLSFDLFMRGGVHLLTIPNGLYSSTYEFSLYDTSQGFDNLIARTSSVYGAARFQLNYAGNHGSQQLVLMQGADNFVFNFESPADIARGKTIRKEGGLRLQSYGGHQIFVKASDNYMYNDTRTHLIPVSILTLRSELYAFSAGNSSESKDVVIYPPIQLSSYEQPIASFPRWSEGIQYSIELSIPANVPEFREASGRYETYLYFVIVPN
ncbi:hypothetical protein [Myroides injenensis]|uniref:hypothetical protein n=1 Tax=Myroides injenensis TaxID=1183151 RepID=UPI00226F17D4|nr:hypothetical protein [Myroides injenensis]